MGCGTSQSAAVVSWNGNVEIHNLILEANELMLVSTVLLFGKYKAYLKFRTTENLLPNYKKQLSTIMSAGLFSVD